MGSKAPGLAHGHLTTSICESCRPRSCHFGTFRLICVGSTSLSGWTAQLQRPISTCVGGGLGSPPLCKLATKLWQWAHSRFLSLRVVHVPGPLSMEVDIMCRGGPSPGKWRLHPQVVELWGHFRRAEVNLFASRESTHCLLFFHLPVRLPSFLPPPLGPPLSPD